MGSGRWRYKQGVRFPSRPVRHDRLDAIVGEAVTATGRPGLDPGSTGGGLKAGREAGPQRRRQAELPSGQERFERAVARLGTAYAGN